VLEEPPQPRAHEVEAGVTEVGDDFQPAPGSRRLLKGGSAGSRSSSSGGGRWGGSSPTTYRAAGASYGYRGSTNAVSRGSSVVVVRRGYYGCYGCYYGCYGCGYRYRNCRSRSSCGHEQNQPVLNNLDRYELDIQFKTPVAGSPNWPMYIRFSDFTLWQPQPATGVYPKDLASYVTFFTSDGDDMENLASMCNILGWVFLVVSSVCLVVFSKFMTADHNTKAVRRPCTSHNTRPANPAMNYRPNAAPMPTAMPTAMPMAQPMATAMPMGTQMMPTAVPMAQGIAFPQNVNPIMQAYPAQAGGYPTAYPTAYPSPPRSPPADEPADEADEEPSHDKSV